MMAQKLMSENKDNPFNSRFFQPSDALSPPRYTGLLLPIERDMFGEKGNFEFCHTKICYRCDKWHQQIWSSYERSAKSRGDTKTSL